MNRPLYGRDALPVATPAERCPYGKLGYFSHADAHAMLEHLRTRRGPGERREQRAYACTACPAWHLTSEPEWPPRRAAR